MSIKRVLVVGNVNLETALQLDTFPLENASSAQPYRLGVNVSGVDFNVARALQALGTEVRLVSVVGSDTVGDLVRLTFARLGMDPAYLCVGRRTGRSLVVADASGARHVHTDLGGVADASYPAARFEAALSGCGLAVLTNINYTRPLLACALTAGVPSRLTCMPSTTSTTPTTKTSWRQRAWYFLAVSTSLTPSKRSRNYATASALNLWLSGWALEALCCSNEVARRCTSRPFRLRASSIPWGPATHSTRPFATSGSGANTPSQLYAWHAPLLHIRSASPQEDEVFSATPKCGHLPRFTAVANSKPRLLTG